MSEEQQPEPILIKSSQESEEGEPQATITANELIRLLKKPIKILVLR